MIKINDWNEMSDWIKMIFEKKNFLFFTQGNPESNY